MSDVIRWEEPPSRAQRSRHEPVASALRERPGQWALVAEGLTDGAACGLADRIRRGKAVAYAPSGAFEAKPVTTTEALSSRVYARYVGGAS